MLTTRPAVSMVAPASTVTGPADTIFTMPEGALTVPEISTLPPDSVNAPASSGGNFALPVLADAIGRAPLALISVCAAELAVTPAAARPQAPATHKAPVPLAMAEPGAWG